MLWVFSGAGLTGVLCGCLFRASAIVVLSFATFGCTLAISVLSHPSLGSAVVTAFLTSAALQMGYLVGIGIDYVWHHVQPRIARFYDGLEVDALPGFLTKARFKAAGERK